MRREELPTPCYLVGERALRHNLEILRGVSRRTGCRILLAQKAFSMFALYPVIGAYLDGAASSGLFEARLAHRHMGGENHTFSPAFRDEDFGEIAEISDHVVFNSLAQYERFGARARAAGASCGLRVNPGHSTGRHALYDPCAPGSRLGIPAPPRPAAPSGMSAGALPGTSENAPSKMPAGAPSRAPLDALSGMPAGAPSRAPLDALSGMPADGMPAPSALPASSALPVLPVLPVLPALPALPEGVEGLHFHTLCEQDADALEETLSAVCEKFGPWLRRVKWINLGGGHHITRPGYDIARLEACIRRMQREYGHRVYLEPGEAVALNAGLLIARVLDVVRNDIDIAILDASAACHMPDVLEMPYRPPLFQPGTAAPLCGGPPDASALAGLPGRAAHTYRLAGPTCLAGDVIGDYSFSAPLEIGARLEFCDMAIYTMVKNNTFNGMPLPAIAAEDEAGDCRIIRKFGYPDFETRLS